MESVVVVSSLSANECFVALDHCCIQMMEEGLKGRGFVPTTFYLPHSVKPRPAFPDGVLRTADDVIRLYHEGMTNIDRCATCPHAATFCGSRDWKARFEYERQMGYEKATEHTHVG
jgi:hypothetical protein